MMIKLIARLLSVMLASFSVCCFAYPQIPRKLLTSFIEARAVSSKSTNLSELPRDVALAKTVLAVFDAKIARANSDSAVPSSAEPDFDSAFFEPEPSSPSDRQRAISIPFLNNDSAANFQPVNVGPQIQANPFLD